MKGPALLPNRILTFLCSLSEFCMSVVVENLSKLYGAQKALDNVSFSVSKGEILGLLGPNGAGKSTTMKIVTGYLLASSGRAEVCGLDVVKEPLKIKQKIGYLPEHNPLYLDMYIREFLSFTGGIFNMPGPRIRTRIEELIELTGLTAERKKKIGQLSKGYRQRVGLAQALIHDPEVLILDEPTTGLDPNQIVEIRNLIAEIGKSKTVILSTHIMQEVNAICNRVVIINRGKIVADKPIRELGRSLSGDPVLRIRFRETYDLRWIKLLDGVQAMRNGEQGDVFVTLNPDLEEAVRATIFTQAAGKAQIIIEMEKREISLEEVFQSLTK
jgi:ABC-2 type transport system ATP-binding protein